MSTTNRVLQQRPATFQIIEPLFYEQFNTKHSIIDGWTLERMPRKVNVKRIVLDENKMAGGWLYESYNTKGRFLCKKCIKNGINERDATWSSAYTTVLFRAYSEFATDEFGQIWINNGCIQMRMFAQQCKTCDDYVTAELDNQRSQNLVCWLHQWTATQFYGYPQRSSYHRRKPTDMNHLEDRCEACATGWCHYLRVKRRRVNTHRN